MTLTTEGEQIDAETFFGISGVDKPKRTFRLNVWSESAQEENQWMQHLLSLTNQHHGRVVDTNLPTYNGTLHIGCSNIPKIIHFIWLGETAMPKFPFLRTENDYCDGLEKSEWNDCVESWKVHHPPSKGWEIAVWTEKNIVSDDDDDDDVPIGRIDATKKFVLKHSEMLNKEAFRHALQIQNYGAASDILRLDILNKFGGVYADIDYFCVGCLDVNITNVQAQFFCGASNTGCVELNNGLMACQKGGHAIVTEMIDSIHVYFENKLSNGTRQEAAISILSSFLDETTLNALNQADSFGTLSPMEVIEHTGPGLLTRSVCRWLVENNGDHDSASHVIIFPASAFHPFPNHLRNNLSTSDETTAQKLLTSFLIPKETMAVHLWGCSWQNEN